MKRISANSQNESADADEHSLGDRPWLSVLRIAQGDEFQQSFAVAQLAVKLWEINKANSRALAEKENLAAEKFLAEAWKLIETAREYVLRPQTDVEYLATYGGTRDALGNVIGRLYTSNNVPFQKLCDPERNKVGTKTINGIEYNVDRSNTEPINGIDWKVYLSERGFDDLFWRYWSDIGEKWKGGDQEIGTVQELDTKGKPRRVNFYSESDRKELATLASDMDAWEKRGELLLDSWKRNGVPIADFSALAEFRKAHDNRAANLKKPKRRRLVKSSRTQQRNHRARGRNGRTQGQER